MLIDLRNALMTGKRLPYDAEVEFLESTGTQWIDTGIFAAYNMKITADCQYVSNTSATQILFGPSANGGNWFGNVSRKFGVGGRTSQQCGTSTTRAVIDFTWLTNDTTATNVTTGAVANYGGSATLTQTNNIRIFGAGGSTSYLSYARVYHLKIIDENSTLVRDYIPVRVGTVGYLYDRVSGALFGNAGTGDFVVGQDVVPVEYIESHGTEYIDTGVPATGATDSEFQFKMSVAGFAFGARTAWNASAYSLNYAAGNYAFNYGNNSVVADLETSIRIDTNWHTAKIQSGGVLSLDEWTGTAGTFSFTTNGSLILFGTRQGSSLNLTASGFKYCKIWENGALIRDYIPVRVGTDATSWEGAMMDTLTRRIYRNAGTGAFGYGNDLKYPIPAS